MRAMQVLSMQTRTEARDRVFLEFDLSVRGSHRTLSRNCAVTAGLRIIDCPNRWIWQKSASASITDHVFNKKQLSFDFCKRWLS